MFYLPDSWLIDINNKERILSFVDEYYFSDIIIIGFNDDRDEKINRTPRRIERIQVVRYIYEARDSVSKCVNNHVGGPQEKTLI